MPSTLKRKLAQMVKKHGYTKTGQILRKDAPYSYAYVHQALNRDGFVAGQPFWDAVAKYNRKLPPKTLTVRYSDDEEERRLKHQELTMDERKEALDHFSPTPPSPPAGERLPSERTDAP